MKTLVICSLPNNQLSKNDLKLIGAAQQLQQPITLLLVINKPFDIDTLPALDNINDVITINSDNNPFHFIKPIQTYIKQNAITHVLANNNNLNKQMLASLAAKLNVGMLTDVTAIEASDCFKRPMYSGDFIATIQVHDAIKIMTIRASAFASANIANTTTSSHHHLTTEETNHLTIQSTVKPCNKDLTTADIIITGGRGLGDAKNYDLIYQLADKLNAAVGATRATVDAGWIDNALQVGQTGKIVAPKIYIAIGVSGAIQHLAGIKDSETIIAINCDSKAPIMQFADYAFVGDLFEVIPQLITVL